MLFTSAQHFWHTAKPSSKSSLFQWTAMGKSIVNNVVPKKGKAQIGPSQKWEGKTCPTCSKGTLSKLQLDPCGCLKTSVQSSQLPHVDEPAPSTPTLHRRPRTAGSVPPNAGRSYSTQVAQDSPEQDPPSSRHQTIRPLRTSRRRSAS